MPPERRGADPLEEAKGYLLIALLATLMPIGWLSGAESEVSGKVGYISGNTVYIDLGQADGLAVGDTVTVTRDGETIGKMVIESTASEASSCASLFPATDCQPGDRVSAKVAIPEVGAGAPSPEAMKPEEPVRGNIVQGRVSFGSLFSDDLTASGLDFTQPSLAARITVDEFLGRPLTLNLRHRTRLYSRETTLDGDTSGDRWTHQVFEFYLSYEDEEKPYRLSFGRLLPSAPRGLGTIDGALLEYRLDDCLTIGAAGGTRPDILSAGFQADEGTFGLFTNYGYLIGDRDRISLSAAFSGSYRSGSVNREYLFLEGDYGRGERLSTSGNVEIDLNRSWKRPEGGGLLEVTSLFLSARYRFLDGISMNLSFDNRRPPRTLDNRSVPDSLFDDSARRGLHIGLSWRYSPRVQVSGGFGMRFREDTDHTLSGSGMIRIADFPIEGVSTSAQLMLFRSTFARGYRPIAGIDLSPTGNLRIGARGGDSITDVSGERSHNPWIGASSHYRLSRRSFLDASLTSYLSERLRSVQLFAETGYLF